MKKYVWNGSTKPSKMRTKRYNAIESSTMPNECVVSFRPESEREIFAVCKGVRTRNRVRDHVRENGTVKSITCTKRFANSRLTCVYKRKEY